MAIIIDHLNISNLYKFNLIDDSDVRPFLNILENRILKYQFPNLTKSV